MKRPRTSKKTVVGTVISDKMNKAVTVQVEIQRRHPMYKKFVISHKKIKARDEKNVAGVGDTVRMVETRPLSKEIHWRVMEVLEKAERG